MWVIGPFAVKHGWSVGPEGADCGPYWNQRPGHPDGENGDLESAIPYLVALIGKPQAYPMADSAPAAPGLVGEESTANDPFCISRALPRGPRPSTIQRRDR